MRGHTAVQRSMRTKRSCTRITPSVAATTCPPRGRWGSLWPTSSRSPGRWCENGPTVPCRPAGLRTPSSGDYARAKAWTSPTHAKAKDGPLPRLKARLQQQRPPRAHRSAGGPGQHPARSRHAAARDRVRTASRSARRRDRRGRPGLRVRGAARRNMHLGRRRARDARRSALSSTTLTATRKSASCGCATRRAPGGDPIMPGVGCKVLNTTHLVAGLDFHNSIPPPPPVGRSRCGTSS